MKCIDLRALPGFRVLNELTNKPVRKADDASELFIPGSIGDVSPYGGELLIASTNSYQTTRRILEAVPGAELWQDADDGANIKFHRDHFGTVAAILHLRKRRVLSSTDANPPGFKRLARAW